MKLSKKIRNTVFIAMSFAMIGSLTLTGCSDGSSDDDTTSITKEEQKPEDNKEEQKTEDNKEEQITEDNKEEQKTEDNKEEQKTEDNKEEQKTEDNKEEQKTEDTNKTDPSETVTITLKAMELIHEKSGDNESGVFKQEITDAEECKKFVKGNKIKVEIDVKAINKSSDSLTSEVIFEAMDGGSDVSWWKSITKEAVTKTLAKDSKITWEVELSNDISKGETAEKVQKAVLFFKLNTETATKGDKVYVNKDLPVEETIPDGASALGLTSADGWGNYDVTEKGDTAVTISHSASPNQYACCGASIEAGVKKISFTVKNNGSAEAWVQFQAQKDSNKAKCLSSATIDEVNADSVEWGAATTIPAGGSKNIVLNLDTTKEADQLVVSLNSNNEKASNPSTGSITITKAYIYK